MLNIFRKHNPRYRAAATLYHTIKAQARQAVFFKAGGVPDTVEGRFDLLVLHGFLVMNRLADEGRAGRRLTQAVFDVMFRDIEDGIREAGVGDLSVPKHMKRMMKAFNGRCHAYKAALESIDAMMLSDTIMRNLCGGSDAAEPAQVAALARYITDNVAHLQQQGFEKISAGDISFAAMAYKEKVKPDDNARMVA